MRLRERLARQYRGFTAWIKLITFYELAVGMKSTLSHLIHYKPITLQYPHEKRILPDNYRGMLALLRYDDGTEKCVGCDLCEAACPSRVIAVVSAEVPEEPTKRYAREYSMDMTRCLFCGMCVQACPVDALAMTREYEWAVYHWGSCVSDTRKTAGVPASESGGLQYRLIEPSAQSLRVPWRGCPP
jgi:NADH-quinone oxidoreductase chain I